MNALRLFVAVFPPPEVQAAAQRAIDLLRVRGDNVSWVRRDNLHFTMRFLGDQDEAALVRAQQAMVAAAREHAPFAAALGALGAFPQPRRARVLWAGLSQGADTLRKLAASIDAALENFDFPADEHEFEPHLTLGRVRTPADWTSRLDSTPAPEARFKVEKLLLVRSTLAAGGSRYDVIGEAPLKVAG